jgi:DMSO/TMAO reductase YedYZ molybdopterin-dependent catalytic subunit
MRFTRAFHNPHNEPRDPRLPPGQYDTGTLWPVLTAEVTPELSVASWTFSVEGLVEHPTRWTWDEIHALPESRFDGDIHCVTTWSKLGVNFTGVSVDTLLAAAGPLSTATHALAFSYTAGSTTPPPIAYTTNFQLDDVTGGKAWVAWEFAGEPLAVEHGGPARLLVPHLYFWKSAKWVAGLRLLDHDQPGFWERNGYHNRGDPWLEQRYEGD